MKKIININLSGRVIPIEDSAYEMLQNYIESLRKYFANEEGRDEIINDIESRIAELMNDKVRKGSDAVTDADINEIISSMGRVEDFEAAEQESAETKAETKTTAADTGYTYTKKTRGRLYRDSNDKIIGGVCSGIANYLNVDPSIVRILFAIITFGGFGLGMLLYIILWIVLPPRDIEGFTGKRLYRNPDDRIIGGVAGGLAAYFGRSARTIRLIFAAPILLSLLMGILNGFRWHYDVDFALNIGFGSISGTFILIYVILWMVLPEANSDYQKMEMRGETVDVNRIRQNVREGMDNMKERMKGWGSEVKDTAQQFSSKAKDFANTRGRAFAGEVRETASRGGSGLGHAIGVIFKAFFLFIAGSIALGIFVSLIVLLFGGVAWWPINNYLWTSRWQQILAWATLILFVIVPLVAFSTWVIRRIIRAKSRSNYLGWTFGGLWALGWVAAFMFAGSLFNDFREYEHNDTPITVTQPANNRMVVTVTQPELEFNGDYGWMDDGNRGWDINNDTLKIAAIKLNVKASADDQYHVTVKKYSFGRSNAEALNRAERIHYEVVSRDSLLDLGNAYAVGSENKFRFQHVEVEILVPVGKKIKFDPSIERKLSSMDVQINRGYRRNRFRGIEFNTHSSDFDFRPGIEYTMGIDGELKGDNGQVLPNPGGDYRYDENKTPVTPAVDSLELEKSIEKKKQELKELEEKKIKQQKPSAQSKHIYINDKTPRYASGPIAPALTEWF
jgi:phage shock protein PspC (stress-responsive transcriptional regulator)